MARQASAERAWFAISRFFDNCQKKIPGRKGYPRFKKNSRSNVRGLVKNHKLALSISDASWSIFREWLEYFGQIFDREIIAVDPKFTSQDCSNCGNRIKKSLSTRTHQCSCGTVLCRDHNAAINILNKAHRPRRGFLGV